MSLDHRENTLLTVTNSRFAPGSSWQAVAYGAGAVAAAASSGTTITVDSGHGFATGDKFLLNPSLGADATFSGADTVQSTTATTIVMGQSYSISKGDVLVNLKVDTGTTAPNYDDGDTALTIYSDMDGGDAVTNNTVTADANGKYEYWVRGQTEIWELILNASGVPAGVIKGIQVAKGTLYWSAFGATPVLQQADISALTDNSGGTASLTLAAITGGGASCENATKNAIASLADQINDIRTVLRNLGLMA